MFKEQPFDAGVVTLNYAEGPAAGPPLVLLHGGSARWQAWETIIPDLDGQWHLYALDLRGHGRSGWVPMRYRLQDYADDLITFLERRVAEPAILFGHSLGGIVALMIAAQRPDRVRAVVVGDSPLTGETWGALLIRDRATLVRWRDLAGGAHSVDEIAEALKDTPIRVPGRAAPLPMREAFGADSPVFAWLAPNLYQQDPDMLTVLLDDFERAVAGYEMEMLFQTIRCPTLLLQADPAAGGLMTDAEVARALPLLAQPTHVRLAGLSHVLHNERKEPVMRALRPFLLTVG
ncbi:MAG TPA: alpha/beta hydrolase [Roseiflexaceae bacterium]|jgi:pimeloyl-ACP methyl ester carboxylesterase